MLKKLNVNIESLHSRLRRKFDLLDDVFLRHASRECIITSGNDSQHMVGSLHYRNRAIDIRTRDLNNSIVQKVYTELKEVLGKNYDVVLEPTHIHIEYDPK